MSIRLASESPQRDYERYIEAFPHGKIPHAEAVAQINTVLARYGLRLNYCWRKGDERLGDKRATWWDVRRPADSEQAPVAGGRCRTVLDAMRYAYGLMLFADGADGTTAAKQSDAASRRSLCATFGLLP